MANLAETPGFSLYSVEFVVVICENFWMGGTIVLPLRALCQ